MTLSNADDVQARSGCLTIFTRNKVFNSVTLIKLKKNLTLLIAFLIFCNNPSEYCDHDNYKNENDVLEYNLEIGI